MVGGVLRWNGGTTGGARVSQIAQVTTVTELLPIMLRVQPVLPVVRCVPVVVTTTHSRGCSAGLIVMPNAARTGNCSLRHSQGWPRKSDG